MRVRWTNGFGETKVSEVLSGFFHKNVHHVVVLDRIGSPTIITDFEEIKE